MRKLIIRTATKHYTKKLSNKLNIEPKKYSTRKSNPSPIYYDDMPRFNQERYRPDGEFHYNTHQASEQLTNLLEQPVTDKTKSLWYPKLDRGLGNWAWLSKSNLQPNYPIYIISKSRPQCTTARALTKMNLDFKIVVEPSEVNTYQRFWHDHVITGDFDTTTRSSIPVRNFVHELCAKDNYWLMDDNIEDFNVLTDNQKYVCRTGTIFRAAEDFFKRFTNVGQAGFNYYSFAKKTEQLPPYYINTRIYSCTFMYKNLSNIGGQVWRGRYNEDTDLSLRILKAGYCTILMNHFLAGKITTQRVKGGNTDSVYVDGDNRLKFAKSLQQQHPDCVRVVKKFNRWHHQVDYKRFNTDLELKPRLDNVPDYGLYLDPEGR